MDFPKPSRSTVHILEAVAEHEREMISTRTKAAPQAAKARGKHLGGDCGNFTAFIHQQLPGGLKPVIQRAAARLPAYSSGHERR
ncbi:recombinase family protein [Pannonibacter sp. Q-1]